MPDDGDRLDPEFIDRCVAGAADVALILVGASPERTLQELVTVRERMKVNLEEPFGTEVATLIAQSFVAAVALRKAEIESTVGNSVGVIQ